MIAEKSYVRTDEQGAMRVGSSRVSLDSVVIGFQEGEAPETIQRNFPTLSLEEVYGAIAYYLANRLEVDGDLRRRRELWDQAVAEQNRSPSGAMRRLQALMSIPEFRSATSDPPVTGASREAAIEKLLSEVQERAADGGLTQEQVRALEEWRRIRHKRRRSEQVESIQAHLSAQLASGDVSEEAKAAIAAAFEAIRKATGSEESPAAGATP